MSLDPEMVAPTLFQVAEPECFLTSYKYYKPILKLLLRKTRPMDQVKLGMDEPQEDEYAIFRVTGFSPLERLVFPKHPGYFLKEFPSFVPNGKEKIKWENHLLHFYKKLNLGKEKTIVSKNPFNSLRVKELVALFPDARFIHIYRHPFEVVPSTMHLWKIVHKQNCLNNKGKPPEISDVVEYLDHFWNVIRKDLTQLPSEQSYILSFEKLKEDPAATIREIYTYFGIPQSDLFIQRIDSFLSEVNGYRSNEYRLSSAEKEMIGTRLSNHLENFGYQ
jgi:omega-hydroxy-beta-dihydromenaquinone-9 sulfotransferase